MVHAKRKEFFSFDKDYSWIDIITAIYTIYKYNNIHDDLIYYGEEWTIATATNGSD